MDGGYQDYTAFVNPKNYISDPVWRRLNQFILSTKCGFYIGISVSISIVLVALKNMKKLSSYLLRYPMVTFYIIWGKAECITTLKRSRHAHTARYTAHLTAICWHRFKTSTASTWSIVFWSVYKSWSALPRFEEGYATCNAHMTYTKTSLLIRINTWRITRCMNLS